MGSEDDGDHDALNYIEVTDYCRGSTNACYYVRKVDMYYITSNESKVRIAAKYLSPFGITMQGKALDLVEIQSDSLEEIAIAKAKQAFSLLNEPLIVNDAGWYITALKGFPGPYIKYINHWLTSEDILRLMDKHRNREVTFKEATCYIDEHRMRVFTNETKGRVLTVDTAPDEIPSRSLFSLSETGKSIAECWQLGIPPVDNYSIWEEFAGYFRS